MNRLILLVFVVSIIFFSACASTVSQQEYDRVNNELSAIQGQLTSLQGRLAEAETSKAEYEGLSTEYEELTKQYDTLKSEHDTLKAEYEGLSTEYEELDGQYEALKSELDALKAEYEGLSTEYEVLSEQCSAAAEETAEIINEEHIEQAIFELVNQERRNNGLDELIWGKNIYKFAVANSRDMATKKSLSYSDYGAYQQVFWATGYDQTDSIANAALTIWQNSLQYEKAFLNEVMVYGAVGVYKSGEIFYVTFISDYFR
jgi:uncharacterized protein YkwD